VSARFLLFSTPNIYDIGGQKRMERLYKRRMSAVLDLCSFRSSSSLVCETSRRIPPKTKTRATLLFFSPISPAEYLKSWAYNYFRPLQDPRGNINPSSNVSFRIPRPSSIALLLAVFSHFLPYSRALTHDALQ
jgi:hypothetical protein